MSSSLLAASALSLMEGRTRREWKLTLQSLRLIGVQWSDLAELQPGDAWKWLDWDATHYREWISALDTSRSNLRRMAELGISVISDLDDEVPEWLQALPAVPWVFYRGELAILDRVTLGFSGQRDAGEESLAITADLAHEAARLGYTVVSGGARGIDMAAHSAVLEAGGATAVILPQGLGTWRPSFVLANPQIGSRILALSEDAPWEQWTTESAMRRNRMIVDISHVFTVPQSGTSGGSHSTGMYALKQGRVTYVPNLGLDFPGNQKLIRHGARELQLNDGHPDLERMLLESAPQEKPAQASLF